MPCAALLVGEVDTLEGCFTPALSNMKATQPQARRVALITGAAQRLGRATALHLAGQGWDVAIHCARSLEAAEQTAAECGALAPQGRFDVFVANLSDAAAVQRCFANVEQHFERVDAVINNASRFVLDSATEVKPEDFDAHLRTNTLAPVLLAQALARHITMRESRGVVINLLDQKLYNLNPDFFSYTLSKAALECANTMLAQALAPWVRVVGVAPGLTLKSDLMSDEDFAALHRLAPLGQSSRPEDIVSAIDFALNNPAITGTTLVVDGGQHLDAQARDFSLMLPKT
jgi:NAD(P)-dependent dehydrogenase (short-subunit alcohol dehydrogenase family)